MAKYVRPALARYTVAVVTTDYFEDSPIEELQVFDARGKRFPNGSYGWTIDPNARGSDQVVRVVVRANGAAAWSVDGVGSDGIYLVRSRSSRMLRAARGRVNPRSLRLRDGRIWWRQAGRSRSAPLR